MFKKFIAGVVVLFGLGVIGYGLYQASVTHEPGWGVGGFIAGAFVVGWGANMLESSPEKSKKPKSDDTDDEYVS